MSRALQFKRLKRLEELQSMMTTSPEEKSARWEENRQAFAAGLRAMHSEAEWVMFDEFN